MANLVVMPRQGNTVESCLILEWKVTEGDKVEKGDILCSVETDKAAIDVESEYSGTVLKILQEADEDVPVLEGIAVIGEAGEDISDLVSSPSSGIPQSDAPQSNVAQSQPEVSQSAKNLAAASGGLDTVSLKPSQDHPGEAISPRARNLAAAKGVDPSLLSGTGPGGRIIERDIQATLNQRGPASPAAIESFLTEGKTMPKKGSGIGGRIASADLLERQELTGEPEFTGEAPSGEYTDQPVKSIRKVIAERMRSSLKETAQLTLNSSAPAAKLKAWRSFYKRSGEELGLNGITINDLVLFAVSRLLPIYPQLNAHFLGDTIRTFSDVNLGIAVDTPKGLMVPVINAANRKSLKTISGEVKTLAAACREGSISMDALSGGTFTVTNLGAFGIENFTPVLNAPEVGILGLGNIQLKPVEEGEEITFLPHLGLSLTIDHQAVDGAPGARFLKALSDALANPESIAAM